MKEWLVTIALLGVVSSGLTALPVHAVDDSDKPNVMGDRPPATGTNRTDSDGEERKTITGAGGELHQVAGDDQSIMTTQQGIPVSDNQNSLKIGTTGPTLLEDFHLREKLFHFDHERIPERVVHARGFGVHGYFENYESLSVSGWFRIC